MCVYRTVGVVSVTTGRSPPPEKHVRRSQAEVAHFLLQTSICCFAHLGSGSFPGPPYKAPQFPKMQDAARRVKRMATVFHVPAPGLPTDAKSFSGGEIPFLPECPRIYIYIYIYIYREREIERDTIYLCFSLSLSLSLSLFLSLSLSLYIYKYIYIYIYMYI